MPHGTAAALPAALPREQRLSHGEEAAGMEEEGREPRGSVSVCGQPEPPVPPELLRGSLGEGVVASHEGRAAGGGSGVSAV